MNLEGLVTRKSSNPQATVRAFVSELARSTREDSAPGDLLLNLCERVKGPGSALAWLVSRDEDPRIREIACMLLFVAAKDPSIPRSIRRPTLRDAGPVLLRAFRSTDVDDDVKYTIGPMAALCGVRISEAEYASAFKDFDGTRSRKKEEVLRRHTSDPEDLERQLEVAGLISRDGDLSLDGESLEIQWELAKAAARTNPPVGAALLCLTAAIASEHGMAAPAMAGDLRLAAAVGTGEALWYLGELGRLPSMGEVGAEAAALAREMAGTGLQPDPPGPGRFVRGMLSQLDGVGSRSLLLLFRSGRRLDALSLLMNDRVGLKDVFCAFKEGKEVEEILSVDRGIVFAPCDLSLARRIVGDALAIHRLAETPPPGRLLLYRHFLGPEPIAAEPRAPDLSAYHLEDLPRTPDLVEGSGDLARLPLCSEHYCSTDAAYRFVERHLRKHSGGGASFQPSPEALREFFERILVHDLPDLIRRLAANLEVEALAGRASRAGNRRLAALYVALSEEVVPSPLVPFLLELQRDGMMRIAENLLMGFRTQAEANAVAAAFEDDDDDDEDDD